MALTLHNNSKQGYYDSVAGKVHTGERMIMGDNIGYTRYYTTSWPYINIIKTGNHLNLTDYARLGTNEYINDGSTWTLVVMSGGVWIPQGTYVLRWTGTADVDFTAASGTSSQMTANASTDVLSCSQNQYPDDVIVRFTTTGILPGGLISGMNYHVVSASGNDFKVSLTQGGEAVDITSTGSGTHYVAWAEETSSAANRKEFLVYGNKAANNALVSIGAGTCSDLELLQPGEETRYDAGNILASNFVSDMAGVACFRTMGMQNTNDSYVRDYADVQTWDGITWYWAMPARAIARVAEELSSDPWISIPHQMTDAAITSFIAELDTYLPVGRKAYIEYSNETWNYATGFVDQFRWTSNGDIDSQDGTMVPATAAVTATSHGLSTGDLLSFYATKDMTRSVAPSNIWPYHKGGRSYVVVDDVNTFRVCGNYDDNEGARRDITGATQANPCVITSAGHNLSNGETVHIYNVIGMTELNGNDYTVANATTDTFELSGVNSSGYTAYSSGGYCLWVDSGINSGVTKVRFKPPGSTKTQHVNHSERSVEVWALCDAVDSGNFAGRYYRVLAGQRTNSDVLTQRLAVQSCRDVVDYTSIACYWRFNNWIEPYYTDTPTTGNTHTGTSSATTLTDSTKTGEYAWTTDEWVGELLVNDTDSSWGTITSNTSNTLTVSSLTGGTNNTFETGDQYRISLFGGATTAEITTYLKTDNGPEVLQQQTDNIIVSGGIPLINYEGGDANGTPDKEGSTKVQPEYDKFLEWSRSSDATDFTNWWCKQLALVGVKLYAHHTSHSVFGTSGYWGRMEHQGDSDSAKHLGHLEFFNNGGAPKP